MNACGVRAIHPRPERRGFPRKSDKNPCVAQYLLPACRARIPQHFQHRCRIVQRSSTGSGGHPGASRPSDVSSQERRSQCPALLRAAVALTGKAICLAFRQQLSLLRRDSSSLNRRLLTCLAQSSCPILRCLNPPITPLPASVSRFPRCIPGWCGRWKTFRWRRC